MAGDADRLARFQREAEVLAALNHPNIAQIYGLEKTPDLTALVMELVEGDDLSQRIARGAIPIDEALPIAKQIAGGARSRARAGDHPPRPEARQHQGARRRHGEGAGLRAGEGDGSPGAEASRLRRDDANSPTLTSRATQMGMIIGTAAYMAPEQARGKVVDRRADIWAFGVVLFEMLTGRRLFGGETVSDTLAAVLRQEIPWTALPSGTPPATRRLLRRCLERDPARRLRDIADARLELDEPIVEEVPARAAQAAAPRRSPGLGVHAAWAVALVSVAGLLWWLKSPSAPDQWQTFTQLTDAAGVEDFPALSPNGELVAYVGTSAGSSDIHVQRPGGRRPTVVAGDPTLDETSPAFSPDSARIAYNLATATGGIFVVGATGESARRLTDQGYHPAWSPDGSRIAYGTEQVDTPYSRPGRSTLWVVRVDDPSAEPTQLTKTDAVQPAWSPSGRRIAFWAITRGQRDIYTVDADGGEPVAVLTDAALDWSPTWSPDGRHVYFSSDRGGSMNLWRIAIDEATGHRRGDPEPVTLGVEANAALPSLSRDGNRLVFRSGSMSANPVAIPFNPETLELGQPRLLFSQTGIRMPQAMSPDGQWLVYSNVGERPEDLFISRPDGTDLRRLTDDEARDRGPKWMPGKDAVAFMSSRGQGQYAIWSIRRDGSGLELLVEVPDHSLGYPVFSPAADQMFVWASARGVLRFNLAGAERPAPSQVGKQSMPFFPIAVSTDARWLAGTAGAAPTVTAVINLETEAFTLVPGGAGNGGQWLPGGHRLLHATKAGGLAVWDVDTGAVRDLGLKLPGSNIVSLVLSPDGRTIYVGALAAQANIWMVERAR